MGLPGQDQEGGLKRVLDILLVLENGPAGGRHRRAIPGHQGLKSDRVVLAPKTRQKLTIRQPGGRPRAEEFAEVLKGCPRRCARHAIGSS
jgi:hypothetical protein